MNRRIDRFAVIVALLLLVFGTGFYAAPIENTDIYPYATYQTLYFLKHNYYDPSLVDYPELLNIALESIEEALKSKNIVVDLSPISLKQSNQDALSSFHEQWNDYIAQHETDDHYIEFAAIDAMLDSFDDSHTLFVNPEALTKFQERFKKKAYSGAGIMIEWIEEEAFILEVLPGSPADSAGILQFDKIFAVNGHTISDFEDVVGKIRGTNGSTVILTVLRKQQLHDITVIRGIVQPPTLTTKLFDNNGKRILYVRLYTFRTNDNLIKVLTSEFMKYRPFDGMIIDIRSNGGGFLQRRNELLEVFLPPNRDLYIERTATDTSIFSTDLEQVYAQPLVVMINQSSASCSEMFSSVLQEQKRAIIVGQQSAGAVSIGGLVEFKLYNAAVIITIRQFFTAGGKKLEGVGVIPDIKVDYTKDDIVAGRDPQLEKAIETLLKSID